MPPYSAPPPRCTPLDRLPRERASSPTRLDSPAHAGRRDAAGAAAQEWRARAALSEAEQLRLGGLLEASQHERQRLERELADVVHQLEVVRAEARGADGEARTTFALMREEAERLHAAAVAAETRATAAERLRDAAIAEQHAAAVERAVARAELRALEDAHATWRAQETALRAERDAAHAARLAAEEGARLSCTQVREAEAEVSAARACGARAEAAAAQLREERDQAKVQAGESDVRARTAQAERYALERRGHEAELRCRTAQEEAAAAARATLELERRLTAAEHAQGKAAERAKCEIASLRDELAAAASARDAAEEAWQRSAASQRGLEAQLRSTARARRQMEIGANLSLVGSPMAWDLASGFERERHLQPQHHHASSLR